MSADTGALNQLHLTGVLQARGAVRYTPAGIAIVEAKLAHESRQAQPAAGPRTVAFEMSAVFPAALAEQVSRLDLGSVLELSGFLAARRQGAKTLVLNVTRFECVRGAPAAAPTELNERSNEV